MATANLPSKLIKTALIRISPLHWNRDVTREDVQDLGASIESAGLLHPVVVRKNGKMYELLAGARRFKVFRNRGEREIRCTVVTCDDNMAREISLVENLKAKKPNSAEWAAGLQELVDLERAKVGRKIRDQDAEPKEPRGRGRPVGPEATMVRAVAEKAGVSVSTIRRVMNQEKLVSTARFALGKDKITIHQANSLAQMTKEDQREELPRMLRETREQTQSRLAVKRIKAAEPENAEKAAIRAFAQLTDHCKQVRSEVNNLNKILNDQICLTLNKEPRGELVKLQSSMALLLEEIASPA